MYKKEEKVELTINQQIDEKISKFKEEIKKLEDARDKLSQQGGMLNLKPSELDLLMNRHCDNY